MKKKNEIIIGVLLLVVGIGGIAFAVMKDQENGTGSDWSKLTESSTAEKNEEIYIDKDLVAEIAWDQIGTTSQQDICNAYYLSPELTEQIAYQTLDDLEMVPNLMRIIRKEC